MKTFIDNIYKYSNFKEGQSLIKVTIMNGLEIIKSFCHYDKNASELKKECYNVMDCNEIIVTPRPTPMKVEFINFKEIRNCIPPL